MMSTGFIDWNTVNMIDVMSLAPSTLRSAPVGSLFVPAIEQPGDGEDPFLVGRVFDTTVLVALRGENPFHFAVPVNWTQRRGYIVENIRVEVDRASARRCREERDMQLGEIVRFDGGFGLVSHHTETTLVDISGKLPEDGQPALIAFSRWRIVTGDLSRPYVLYHYTGDNLLFGPFDESIDENG